METNLVVEGLKFMALGMGTVFLFLVIMIAMMILQAKVIQRFFPEPNEGSLPLPPAQQTQQSKNNKVAAIVAAIALHRRGRLRDSGEFSRCRPNCSKGVPFGALFVLEDSYPTYSEVRASCWYPVQAAAPRPIAESGLCRRDNRPHPLHAHW